VTGIVRVANPASLTAELWGTICAWTGFIFRRLYSDHRRRVWNIRRRFGQFVLSGHFGDKPDRLVGEGMLSLCRSDKDLRRWKRAFPLVDRACRSIRTRFRSRKGNDDQANIDGTGKEIHTQGNNRNPRKMIECLEGE
jgi:hypothetical protein